MPYLDHLDHRIWGVLVRDWIACQGGEWELYIVGCEFGGVAGFRKGEDTRDLHGLNHPRWGIGEGAQLEAFNWVNRERIVDEMRGPAEGDFDTTGGKR